MLLDDTEFGDHAVLMKGEYLRTPLLSRLLPPSPCKALIIGSCLANYIIRKDLWCEADLLLFNGGVLQPLGDAVQDYDFVLVQMPLRAILRDGEGWHNRYNHPEDHEADYQRALSRLQEYLGQCLAVAQQRPVFVSNFLVPVCNPMGKLLPRYDLRNLAHFVQRLNEDLERQLQRRGAHHTHLLDIDAIANTIGKRFLSDEFYNALNHAAPGELDLVSALDPSEVKFQRFDPIPAAHHHWQMHDAGLFGKMISHELQAMQHSRAQPARIKLLVVDLDNTLWRGVLSEEAQAQEGRVSAQTNRAFYNNFGIDDGSLYRLAEGFPYSITEALHYCKMRGILLAIISKNNHDDTVCNIERVYAGKLQLDSFVAVKINWLAKSENMRQILQQTNLLPHNVMFIDDNPLERRLMDQAYPEMAILGKWIMYVKSTLHHSVLTDMAVISEDSELRTSRLRQTLAHQEAYDAVKAGTAADGGSSDGTSSALAALCIRIAVDELPADARHPRFQRSLELLNKTNQFNLNGLRLAGEALQQLLQSGSRMFALTVADRYTEHGLVGVALINTQGVLVQLAISCRVLGLQVETAFLGQVMKACGLPRVALYYRATDKNFPLTAWLKGSCAQEQGLYQLPCTELPAHLSL